MVTAVMTSRAFDIRGASSPRLAAQSHSGSTPATVLNVLRHLSSMS